MNCNEAQSLMLDRLYGGLKPRKEKALLFHLGECSACAKEYETHKATASAFSHLDMEEPPPGLTAKVIAMAAEDIERQKSSRKASGAWRWTPTLATAAAAVLAVVFVVRFIPDNAKAPQSMTALDTISEEMLKDVVAPQPPAERENKDLGALSKQPAVRSEMGAAPSDEYRASPTMKAKPHFYDQEAGEGWDRNAGMERDSFDSDDVRDDISMDNLAAAEPDVVQAQPKYRGVVGGKISVDGPRSSERQSIVSGAANERQLKALGYTDSGSLGRSDSDGYSERSRANKEAKAKRPGRTSLSFQYSHADDKKSLKLDEGVAAPIVQPEALAAAKPQSMPVEPEPVSSLAKAVPAKKEKAAGGVSAFADSSAVDFEIANRGARKVGLDVSRIDLQAGLDIAQEEAPALNGELFDGQEFNEAVAEFEKGVHRKPDTQFAAEARFKLGRTYQEEDDCEKALAVYETIPEEHPDFDKLVDVYIAMGECYLKLNRFDDAKGAFELVREKFPKKSELVKRRLGEIATAQKALEKANEDAAEIEK